MPVFGSQAPAKLTGDEQWLQQMSAQYARNQQFAKPGPWQTTLDPGQEQAFRGWVAENKVPFQPEGYDPQDYDMRGYWRDIAAKGQSEQSLNPNDNQMHFPDTYKTPWHQSFSAESQYAKPNAPVWINDHQLVDIATGRVVFDERAGRK